MKRWSGLGSKPWWLPDRQGVMGLEVRASAEDYLEAILLLQRRMGVVRSVDVAQHLEVSKPSVCHAVASLRAKGFLRMDQRRFLILTEAGRSIAEITLEKHQFFSAMLMEAGVDPKSAEKEACRIEHAISTESFERLKRLKKEYTNHSTGGTCAD